MYIQKTLSAYVIAESFNDAKNSFEEYLNKQNYDWSKNRTVIKIELIASTDVYPANEIMNKLFIVEDNKDINKNNNDNVNKWWTTKGNEKGDGNANEIKSNEVNKRGIGEN